MKTILYATVAAALLALAAPARAEIKSKEIEYKQGDTALVAFLAWDDAVKGKRPGVLVIHEWWGHNQHARNQALRLAKSGYVGLSIDMYGKGKVADATHPKDAQAFMEATTKDPAVVVARFNAGLERLKAQPQVDAEKVAAIGYCFGGGVAMAMARGGADLDAVATFHGAIQPDGQPLAQKGKVKAKILVLTGADDPFVPPAAVAAFDKEMKDAGASFEVVAYPGVKHSFTNPDAAKAGMDALKYDADADTRSWAKLLEFLGQAFETKK